MWIRVTEDFDWRQPGFTIAYKSGWVGNVPHEAGEAAIAAGRAVRLKPPRKSEEPQERLEQKEDDND